jgi:GNAT superfamily N-acetyltransferase
MIRIGTEVDLPAICALGMEVNVLHHDACPNVFAPAAEPERDHGLWNAFLKTDGARIYIAESNGQALGMVTAPARGQGIGKELMATVETWARSQGVTDIRLNVWDFNRRAIKLYEEIGFNTRSRIMSKVLD